MSKKLIFATRNAHKVSEVQSLLKRFGDFSVYTLDHCNVKGDAVESAHTLEGNAEIKAHYTLRALGRARRYENFMVFADDSGLEIEALQGAPGVRSARYSGGGTQANIDLVLSQMEGVENRTACFRTAICLIDLDGQEHLFEGRVDGTILTERRGCDGFGYDPIFQPVGYSLSFAELSMERKNMISHRSLAVGAMATYLLV